jgi:hypothetical protein
MSAKYVEMLEEKSALYREINQKKKELAELEQELSLLLQKPSASTKYYRTPVSTPISASVSTPISASVSRPMSFTVPAAISYDDEMELISGEPLDLDSLVSWPTILKDRGVGTLSSLRSAQKQRLDEAVYEFLSQFLSPSDVLKCKVVHPNTKKELAAVPRSFIPSFEDWLGKSFSHL